MRSGNRGLWSGIHCSAIVALAGWLFGGLAAAAEPPSRPPDLWCTLYQCSTAVDYSVPPNLQVGYVGTTPEDPAGRQLEYLLNWWNRSFGRPGYGPLTTSGPISYADHPEAPGIYWSVPTSFPNCRPDGTDCVTVRRVEAGWVYPWCVNGAGPLVLARFDSSRRWYCPGCPADQVFVSQTGTCKRTGTVNFATQPPLTCGSEPGNGNPIVPTRGTKRQIVETGLSIGGVPFKLTYDTTPLVQQLPSDLFRPTNSGLNANVLGPLWSSSLHRSLKAPYVGVVSASGQTPGAATISRGDGYGVLFSWSPNLGLQPNPGQSDRLVPTTGGYRFTARADRVQEEYDSSGRIVTMARADGERLLFIYSDASVTADIAPGAGYLIRVQDSKGRSVRFTYAYALIAGVALLNSAKDDAGGTTTFAYDNNGNLISVTWPDGTVRTFVYEMANVPQAMTGLRDENGSRLGTYSYAANGLVIGTQTGSGANRFSVAYTNAPYLAISQAYDPVADLVWRTISWAPPAGVIVTGPLGATSAMTTTSLLGRNNRTSQTQPAGSGCDASSSSQAYDAAGNMSVSDDFNGTRVCRAFDPSRNVELTRVEGLAAGASCSATGAGVPLPNGARKISTEWHPDWNLRRRESRPGTITTWVYNGQPDPFASGAPAACAPASAVLPDSKPIAVLCHQVEQATTDADGSLGFGATLQASVATREQRWTYNAQGQLLTHDGPRTDIADITTYEYYTDTAFSGADPNAVGHTVGDLRRVTNAAGHVTQHTLYDKLGKLLRSVDPNGVVTSYSYDARQRMNSSSVGGQTTTYAWWPTGLIQRVTAPDGSWTFFEHDDANRLTRISDNLGNSVSYTLDAVGNRVAEQAQDPSGTLRRLVGRGIDALGRVQQISGRE
jgi:YD repeat-containing protein